MCGEKKVPTAVARTDCPVMAMGDCCLHFEFRIDLKQKTITSRARPLTSGPTWCMLMRRCYITLRAVQHTGNPKNICALYS